MVISSSTWVGRGDGLAVHQGLGTGVLPRLSNDRLTKEFRLRDTQGLIRAYGRRVLQGLVKPLSSSNSANVASSKASNSSAVRTVMDLVFLGILMYIYRHTINESVLMSQRIRNICSIWIYKNQSVP